MWNRKLGCALVAMLVAGCSAGPDVMEPAGSQGELQSCRATCAEVIVCNGPGDPIACGDACETASRAEVERFRACVDSAFCDDRCELEAPPSQPDAGVSLVDAGKPPPQQPQPDAAPSSPPDAAPPPPDTDDPVVRLTPIGIPVSDVAIGPSDLAVSAINGLREIWRCPLSGCQTPPLPLATMFFGGESVALADGHVFFVDAGLPRLRRVKLDGTGLENAANTSIYKTFSSSLAQTRGRAYVGYGDAFSKQGAIELDASSIFPMPTAQPTGTSSTHAGEIAAGTKWLVYAPYTLSAAEQTRPFHLWSFVDGEASTTAPITFKGWGRAMAVAGDLLFLADGHTLRACDLSRRCTEPVVVATGIEDTSIATDGTRVYFGKATSDGKPALQSCPATAAACAPRVHHRSRLWVQPMRIAVDASHVYLVDAIGQGVFRVEK